MARRRHRGRVLSFVSVAAIAACGVGTVDLAGRECPCASGYVCDTTTNTCVTALPDRFVPGDGGDGGPDVIDAGPPSIVVSNLRKTWVTSNSIRWDWVAEGDPADFQKYVLVTGPTEIDVRDRTFRARIWTADDYPELGFVAGRDLSQAGQKVPLWTVTDEQAENAQVFARVIATDKNGVESLSNVASATTMKNVQNRLAITEDVTNLTPAQFKLQETNCISGSKCYAAIGLPCGPTETSCSTTLGRTNIDDVADMLMDADFPNAFLEVQVAGSAKTRVPGKYDAFTLSFGNGCGNMNVCKWRYTGWSFRNDGKYRVIQVPLSQLRHVAAAAPDALTMDEVKARQKTVSAFFVDGTWGAGADVFVDGIRIRW